MLSSTSAPQKPIAPLTQSATRTLNKTGNTSAQAPVPAVQTAQTALDTLVQQHIVPAFQALLDTSESDPETIDALAQTHKLNLWWPDRNDADNKSVQTTVAAIDATSGTRQTVVDLLAPCFVAQQPELKQAPDVLVVPLGLHPLNAIRIIALLDALMQLSSALPPGALDKTHIYFVGGRELDKAEYQPAVAVMNTGLGIYDRADWVQPAHKDLCKDVLAHLGGMLRKCLGEEGLQLEHQEGVKLGETDSAQRILQAKGASGLLERFEGRIHFIEGGKAGGRDGTQDNATHVFDDCRKRDLLGKNAGTVVVCTDGWFHARVSATFEEKFGPAGASVTCYSAPVTGYDKREQVRLLNVLLPLMVREMACLLHQYVETRKSPVQ